MHIFVYEFTCSPSFGAGEGMASLRQEGRAMLQAVLEDLARVPGMTISTLLAEDIHLDFDSFGHQFIRTGREEGVFRTLAYQADFSLVIAPEFDKILFSRCRWVEEAGGRLLGPSGDAVRLTSDKWRLARRLSRHGIQVPACQLGDWESPPSSIPFPLVIKPRRGAGSRAMKLVRSREDWANSVAAVRNDMPAGDFLVQAFAAGQTASVAFLLGPGTCLPLLPASQQLSKDGRFRYLGGEIPLEPGLARRAVALGQRAVQCVRGLNGYVGVDLVLGHSGDASADWVIEINSRLTTSYVGLRALARSNLAEHMIAVASGSEAPEISWRHGRVQFQPDGQVDLIKNC